jgi:hypothetical protein
VDVVDVWSLFPWLQYTYRRSAQSHVLTVSRLSEGERLNCKRVAYANYNNNQPTASELDMICILNIPRMSLSDLLFTGNSAVAREPGLCCTSVRGIRHSFDENAGQKLQANRQLVLRNSL